jgi:hypothetical protein
VQCSQVIFDSFEWPAPLNIRHEPPQRYLAKRPIHHLPQTQFANRGFDDITTGKIVPCWPVSTFDPLIHPAAINEFRRILIQKIISHHANWTTRQIIKNVPLWRVVLSNRVTYRGANLLPSEYELCRVRSSWYSRKTPNQTSIKNLSS